MVTNFNESVSNELKDNKPLMEKIKIAREERKADKVITFSREAQTYILGMLNLSVDDEGYIIKDNKRALDSSGNICHIDRFAGYNKRLGIITKGFPDLIKVADEIDYKNERV